VALAVLAAVLMLVEAVEVLVVQVELLDHYVLLVVTEALTEEVAALVSIHLGLLVVVVVWAQFALFGPDALVLSHQLAWGHHEFIHKSSKRTNNWKSRF